ncbi:MAG: hypothetical protein KAT37_04670 [Candidatus Aenigmarchaeota archaeon]|nr:hypothetical protein [Candidatus Aenigmarchaeota archaeon]
MSTVAGAFALTQKGLEDIVQRTYNMQVYNQNRGEKAAAMTAARNTKVSFDTFNGNGFVHDALGNELKHLKSNEPVATIGYNMRSRLVGREPHTVSGKKYKVAGAMDGYLLDSKKPLNRTITECYLNHLEDTKDFEEAGIRLMQEYYGRGPYTAIFMVNDGQETSQIIIRDPFGMKPLNLAVNDDVVLTCSENVGFQKARMTYGEKFDVCRPVEPGEMIILNSSASLNDLKNPNIIYESNKTFGDIFEYFYSSNKNSVFDGVPVGIFRKNLGVALTEMYPEINEIDEITYSPDSGLSLSEGLGLTEGFIKRPKQFLTKIPGSKKIYLLEDREEREHFGDLKWQLDEELVKEIAREYGRPFSVIIAEDSIVTGNNCKKMNNLFKIVEKLVSKLYYGVSAPPLRFPSIDNIESFDRQKYVAEGLANPDVREIDKIVAKKINSDGVFYMDLETAVKTLGRRDVSTEYFTGDYPVLLKYLKKYDFNLPKGYSSLLD